MNVRFEVLLLQPMLEASLVILYCDCAGGDSVCPLFGWFLVGSTHAQRPFPRPRDAEATGAPGPGTTDAFVSVGWRTLCLLGLSRRGSVLEWTAVLIVSWEVRDAVLLSCPVSKSRRRNSLRT